MSYLQPPFHFLKDGQMWIDDTPRCYKCKHWQSNMPLTGTCALGKSKGTGRTISSHDTMPRDACKKDYSPIWTKKETTNG